MDQSILNLGADQLLVLTNTQDRDEFDLGDESQGILSGRLGSRTRPVKRCISFSIIRIMDPVTYNIPPELVTAYRGRSIVVRASDPGAIVKQLSGESLDLVQYVQLVSAGIDPESLTPLANWGLGIPLDLVLNDPVVEFPLLYNFSKLVDKHPVRVSIAVKPGFTKAVKLALALNFAIKLVVGQPEPALIDEMREVLDLYLHRAQVAQPIDYFHGLFLSYFRQEPATLWSIQEEDPDQFCFVSDEGHETVSPRFAGIDPRGDTNDAEAAEGGPHIALECDQCAFVDRCGGYFKWPDRSFSCDGVKTIFGTLNDAAAELRNDLEVYAGSTGGAQP